MGHYLTQPEEVDFVLMVLEQQGMELEMFVQQDERNRYGTSEAGFPPALPSDPRIRSLSLA